MSMATLQRQNSKLKGGFDRDARWSLFYFSCWKEYMPSQRSKKRLGDVKGIFLPRGTRQ
jgi:hypothetical protein